MQAIDEMTVDELAQELGLAIIWPTRDPYMILETIDHRLLAEPRRDRQQLEAEVAHLRQTGEFPVSIRPAKPSRRASIREGYERPDWLQAHAKVVLRTRA